jgi:hypothetical protein
VSGRRPTRDPPARWTAVGRARKGDGRDYVARAVHAQLTQEEKQITLSWKGVCATDSSRMALPTDIRPTYDGILLSAVIMHIPDAELFDARSSFASAYGGEGGSSCGCRSNETMSRPAMSATSWAGS